jgi:hypothetical protein
MDGALSDKAPSPPPSRGTKQAGSKARPFEHRDVRVRAGPACAAATRKTARSRKDRAAAVPGRAGYSPESTLSLASFALKSLGGRRPGPLLGPAEGRNETALHSQSIDAANRYAQRDSTSHSERDGAA